MGAVCRLLVLMLVCIIGKETYDWDDLDLDERWERHELQVEREVELWNV